MKKKIIIPVAIVIFLLIIIIYTNQVKIPTAQSIINKLTSKEVDGRLVGTLGNEKAGAYIAKLFKNIGLEPWQDGDYFSPYQQASYDPQKQKIKITYNNKELLLGKDYIPSSLVTQNITAPITFDIYDPDIKNKILICKEDELVIARDLDYLSHLYVLENFRGKANIIEENDTRTPSMQITQETYDKIKAENPKEMSIDIQTSIERKEENNIVGKITGKDPDKAIVISAHFDHVGKWGDLLFGGTIDNASGVATLIKIAENVQKQKQDLEATIIFVAFNGEENKLKGSKDFVNNISGEYKNIYNINIDCVGDPKGYQLDSDPGSINLINAMLDSFTKEGQVATWTDDGTENSDHQSFLEIAIPSLNITSIELLKKTHSPKDTKESIDMEAIEELIKTVSNYIIEKNSVIIEYKEKHANKREAFNAYLYGEEVKKIREEQNMAYDDIYITSIPEITAKHGERVVITGKTRLKDLDEIAKYYPNTKIKESIGDYKFLDLLVDMGFSYNNFINLEQEFNNPNYMKTESNQVFKRDVSFANANHIILRYKHNEYIMEIIITPKTKQIPYQSNDKKSVMEGDYSNYSIYQDSYVENLYSGFELNKQHPKYHVMVTVTPKSETIVDEYIISLGLLWEEDSYKKIVETIDLLDLENNLENMIKDLGL